MENRLKNCVDIVNSIVCSLISELNPRFFLDWIQNLQKILYGVEMVDYEKREDGFVCKFSGRMDTAAAMSAEEEFVDRVQHADAPVILDFTDLEYVASSFLRSCVKVVRVAPGKIKVVGASDEIARIFDMTGFAKLMDFERS